jgi:(p)ppGpp synthase/HD superfamily hydrolase
VSELLALAEALARYVHRDQVDKQGAPYVGHLERVVGRLIAEGVVDEEVLAAAWLHDAVEDRRLSGEALDRIMPVAVVDLVDWLTRRRNMSYAAYIDNLVSAAPPAARLIKLADLRDNLDPERGPIPEGLRQRYERSVARLEAARAGV